MTYLTGELLKAVCEQILVLDLIHEDEYESKDPLKNFELLFRFLRNGARNRTLGFLVLDSEVTATTTTAPYGKLGGAIIGRSHEPKYRQSKISD